MPTGKYDAAFGGGKGSAAKAKRAMAKEYGPEKGERVFYATKNARTKGAPKSRTGGMRVGMK